MEYVIAPLAVLLAISLCANVWLGIRRQELKASVRGLSERIKAMGTEPTFDCRQLLHDLSAGAGLIKVTRLDPTEIYVRRT